jgi:8-oxo-dGTP pyrophosphatase MutT (NUDIX family)
VLLLDEHHCTLLFCANDHQGSRFWFTPGGGANPGESPQEAALRELTEETGLTGVELGPEIWVRTRRGVFDGVMREFRERWFVVTVARFELDTSGFDQLERDTILEHRWWSLDELRACPDRLMLPRMADHLESLLTSGPPPAPVDLSDSR